MSETKILVSSSAMDDLVVEQRITNELLRSIHKAEKDTKSIIGELNERQKHENKTGKRITIIMLFVALLAFYVEIIKIDDLSLIKHRTIEFVNSVVSGKGV